MTTNFSNHRNYIHNEILIAIAKTRMKSSNYEIIYLPCFDIHQTILSLKYSSNLVNVVLTPYMISFDDFHRFTPINGHELVFNSVSKTAQNNGDVKYIYNSYFLIYIQSSEEIKILHLKIYENWKPIKFISKHLNIFLKLKQHISFFKTI